MSRACLSVVLTAALSIGAYSALAADKPTPADVKKHATTPGDHAPGGSGIPHRPRGAAPARFYRSVHSLGNSTFHGWKLSASAPRERKFLPK